MAPISITSTSYKEIEHQGRVRVDSANTPLPKTKLREQKDVFICGPVRPLSVLFSGKLEPTPKNIIRVMEDITRQTSHKFDTVIMSLFSTTVNNDPRIEWLKRHQTKVFSALLNHDNEQLSRAVASFLSHRAWAIKNPSVEQAFVEMLSHADNVVKSAGASALARRKPLLPRTMEAICKLLDHHTSAQVAALEVLARADNIPNRHAERRLITIVKDAHNAARYLAVQALALLTHRSAAADHALVDALKRDSNPTVRSFAALVLGERGAGSSNVVAALKWSVQRDGSEEVCAQSLMTLGKLGAVDASTVITIVDPLLTSSHYLQRAAALYALLSAPKNSAAQLLGKVASLLSDPMSDVRGQALNVIAYIKPQSPLLAQKIITLLRDSQWSVRLSAVAALASIGLIAKPLAVPALTALLRRETHQQVKAGIKEVLDQFAKMN